jgi:hypothetical protein
MWTFVKSMRWQSIILVFFLSALVGLNIKQYQKVESFELIKFSELTRSEGILFFEKRGKYQITGLRLPTSEVIYFTCSLPLYTRNVSCLIDKQPEQFRQKRAVALWTNAYHQKFSDTKYLMQLTVDGKVVGRNSYEWRNRIVTSLKSSNLRDNLGLSLLLLGLIALTVLIEGFRYNAKRIAPKSGLKKSTQTDQLSPP